MKYFKRGLPEEQGISSVDIIRFLEQAKSSFCHIHAFLLLRHGKVVAEGYQYPYRAEDKRLLNSISKTVTALGIGVASDEKRLSLQDKVLSFFPEQVPDIKEEKLKEMTLYHLLTMSTGHAEDSLYHLWDESDWVRSFFQMELLFEPGERFQYDSGASFILSAIISRVTGMPLDEYLKIKLFAPLHIEDYTWDRYRDITTGGWGLMLMPEDIAKLGLLFMQKGIFENKRIISEEWLEKAVRKQIDTYEKESRPDWAQGYGFQMWRSVGDGFRADGAFGQFCLIYPREDIILSLTSEDGFSQELLTAFYNNIVTKVQNIPLYADAAPCTRLAELLCEMERPFTYDATASYLEREISGKKYLFQEDIGGINKEIIFEFTGSRLSVIIAGTQTICSSKVCCIDGEMQCIIEPVTVLPVAEARKRSWKYSAHHKWINDTMLQLNVCYIETGHSQQIIAEFNKTGLRLFIENGCKRLLEIIGMQSSNAMEFADVILEARAEN